MKGPDLSMLNPRERQIYEARRTEPRVPLSALAQKFGVSRQMIHRIERRVIAKLEAPTAEQIHAGLSQAERRVLVEAAAVLRRVSPLSWEQWKTVGEAVTVVRNAIKQVGGSRRLLWACLREFGLDLDPSVVVRLNVVMRNRASIEEYRSSITPAKRLDLNHPQHVLKAWKKWLASRSEPTP